MGKIIKKKTANESFETMYGPVARDADGYRGCRSACYTRGVRMSACSLSIAALRELQNMIDHRLISDLEGNNTLNRFIKARAVELFRFPDRKETEESRS